MSQNVASVLIHVLGVEKSRWRKDPGWDRFSPSSFRVQQRRTGCYNYAIQK